MPVPYVRVQVAFDSAPDDPVQTWTDISADVRLADGIRLSRGRSDEFSSVEPGRLSLTLDNTGGAYTYGMTGAGWASGAAWGASMPWTGPTAASANVKPGKRIRVSVSTDGETWSPRFDGYVDGWPTEWANGITQQPRVRITATDRLARTGLQRRLRDALHEELGTAAYDQGNGWVLDDATLSVLDETTVLAGGTVWLYGLQESSGSTVFGDVSGAAGRPNLATTSVGTPGDATAEAGTAGIMPEGTAVRFEAASAGNGRVLHGTDVAAYLGTEFSLWCQFAWSGTSGVTLVTMGAAPKVVLSATSSTVVATFTGAEGASATATKTITTNDNAPHFALVSVSGTTISLYVDEETAATGTVPSGMGYATGLTIGGTTSTDPHQVAWVGYSNAAMSAARAGELGMLGSGGSESSDARVSRILKWLGLSSDASVETGLSDVAYQAAGDGQALDLIAAVNAVEGGVFFPSGDGMLVQHSRDHRYNPIVRLALDAADVDADLTVAVDATRVLNDYTVSRPRGATYRVRDSASVADYGEHSRNETLYAATDDALKAAAEWRVGQWAQPAPRIPSIGVNLLTQDAPTALSALALEIGDRVQVTGLPSATTPGGATVDLFVEGVEESISHRDWSLSLATSWASFGATWTLDDATYSALDSTTVLAY